jgi:hypothetical protein
MTLSISDYIVLNGRMSGETMNLKEVGREEFWPEIQNKHLPGATEENNKKPESR